MNKPTNQASQDAESLKKRLKCEIENANCCGYRPDMIEIYQEIEALYADRERLLWAISHFEEFSSIIWDYHDDDDDLPKVFERITEAMKKEGGV